VSGRGGKRMSLEAVAAPAYAAAATEPRNAPATKRALHLKQGSPSPDIRLKHDRAAIRHVRGERWIGCRAGLSAGRSVLTTAHSTGGVTESATARRTRGRNQWDGETNHGDLDT
jgi:hypothetical protein